MHCGHDIRISAFSCTLAFLCNLLNKLNIHFNFYFAEAMEKHVPVLQEVLTWFHFLSLFHRLTPSDARTVSIIMRGTWSEATPLLIMVLLRLAPGQEAPLVPGKTYNISPHWYVFSSVTMTLWSGSTAWCVCLSVCVTVWLLHAWHHSSSLSPAFCTPVIWPQKGNIVGSRCSYEV